MKVAVFFAGLALGFALVACKPKPSENKVLEEEALPGADFSSIGNVKLSAYGFFTGPLKQLLPVSGVIPYSLNSPLFSDYAFKKRFIRIPPGGKARYSSTDVFEFPEGTVLIKNFYYPSDFRKPDDARRLLETRLLIKEKSEWRTLPYVWNAEQTEAFLDLAGSTTPVTWIHNDGSIRKVNYSIPSTNQCKSCHLKTDRIVPIGLTARQLNAEFDYAGARKNQLIYWREKNMLEGLPAGAWPALAAYDDQKAPVSDRARAWLEVNCAHCHQPEGSARNSGLHLLAAISNPAELGVGKAPVAAGKGTGGRLFAIVPGKPDESILQYRIESTDPGIMMPEMGRKVVHEEGVELVRAWILSL